MTFAALVLNRPIVLMKFFTPASPSANISAGVFAASYNPFVALLTLTSVACADSKTEISSSKVDEYASSVVGVGFSSRSFAKI